MTLVAAARSHASSSWLSPIVPGMWLSPTVPRNVAVPYRVALSCRGMWLSHTVPGNMAVLDCECDAAVVIDSALQESRGRRLTSTQSDLRVRQAGVQGRSNRRLTV